MAKDIPEVKMDEVFSTINWGKLASQAKSIINFLPVIKAQRRALADSVLLLREKLQEYEDARYRLLEEKMREDGKGWCSFNKHIVFADKIQLVYINKNIWEPDQLSGGYPVETKQLHWVCPECLKCLQESNTAGHDDDEELFYRLYPAKKEEDIFLCETEDTRTPLPANIKPERMSDFKVSQMASQYDIPPAINPDYVKGRDALIISLKDDNRHRVVP